jgi:hypothetical protein
LPYEFDTDNFLEGLYYILSSTGFTGSSWTTCDDAASESAQFSAVLNVGAISGAPALVWSLEATEDSDDITAISLVIDSSTGEVTWTNSTAGVYTFIVTVTNAYGCVFGQQEITLTISAC